PVVVVGIDGRNATNTEARRNTHTRKVSSKWGRNYICAKLIRGIKRHCKSAVLGGQVRKSEGIDHRGTKSISVAEDECLADVSHSYAGCRQSISVVEIGRIVCRPEIPSENRMRVALLVVNPCKDLLVR